MITETQVAVQRAPTTSSEGSCHKLHEDWIHGEPEAHDDPTSAGLSSHLLGRK